MDKQSPQISVVMSVYNGDKYLREAVGSILNQAFTDFEFIIVDDGSTDSTAEILGSYTDARIVLIKNEKNIGLAESLNGGIALARGEYIARMDADDISFPERLKEQVAFLDNNPSIGVLGTGMEFLDHDGNKTGRKLMFPETPNLIKWTLFFQNSIAHPSAMMRRSLLVQVGCYQESQIAEDYDLWYRISQVTKLYNLPLVLIMLRKHETQLTNTRKTDISDYDLSMSQRMFSHFFEKPIPAEWISCIRGNNCTDYKIINDSCKFILAFNKKFTVDYVLSEQEICQIQKSTADKIFKLARRGGYHSFIYVIWACVLNPPIIKRILLFPQRKLNLRNVNKL